MSDASCTAAEAVARALLVANPGKGVYPGQYIYGTGNYLGAPACSTAPPDSPWTGPKAGSDCAGFAICYCWKLKRHRPGFNEGPWATVADDINCNSALEDAQHKRELFDLGAFPLKGDLLLYPTIRLVTDDGVKTFVGHVAIVVDVPAIWKGRYHELTVIQCHGPDGFTPGAVQTDGSIWDHHDMMWPKEEHKSHLVRPKERA